MKILKRKPLAAFAASAVLMLGAQAAVADMAAAKKWVNDEFQPSTITKQQQNGRNGMVHRCRQTF